MKFVVNLVFREMRASWHRLFFFFICIAMGVGSIVSLRSLVQNIKASMAHESRSLLTADIQVSSNSQWNAETRAALEPYYNSQLVEGHTEILEMATMLRPLSNAKVTPKLVEVKAVQSGFPFYGEVILNDGLRYSHDLLKGQGLLVKPSLLTALDLKIGDRVRIGSLDFTIRGSIDRDPGNALSGFALAPRVLIDYNDALAAGISSFGSRVRYRVLFKTRASGMEPVLKGLLQDLRTQRLVTIRTYRDSQNRLSESLTQVEDYLSLIGLVILVLGGIGISSVTRVFIQQKMKTIAILKCLGGDNNRVLGAYLAQVLLLGLMGSCMGLLLAQVAAVLLPKYLVDQLPFNVEFGLTWQASLQGAGVGLLISLLFSLVPLLEIRQIKPILVLRSLGSDGRSRFDGVKIMTSLIVILGLLAVASWQGGSLKIGGIFLASFAAMTIVLNLAATALMKFLSGMRHIPSFVWRQGINSLYRPGNQTRIILMAVGLGVFFIVAVRSLQLNLRSEFSLNLDAVRADLYMIDIQRDQRQGVEELIAKHTGSKPELIPTVRAHISRINSDWRNPGRGRNSGPPREERGMFNREYVLTYRPNLEDSEKVLDGKFWDPTPSSEPEVSIEELLHDELDVNVGDSITFDIQGPRITARVTSIRHVDWRNARTGFFIVFRPGVLDQAPAMYISAIKGPAAVDQRAQFQREVVDRYPNISVVDVMDIVEIARGIVRNVSLTVSFVGGFIFLSGLLILIGSIAMTKFHRLYESAILKTLGAKKRLIISTILVEYGVLGLLAGVLGSSAAIALNWAISQYVLKITWRFMPSVNLVGVVAALILVTAVGVLSSWDVMAKKPLGTLRAE